LIQPRTHSNLLAEENVFFSTPIKDLVGRTRESRENWLLKSTDSVAALCSLFTDGGYHRALVIDEEALALASADPDGPNINPPLQGACVVLLTQTDLIRFLWDTLHLSMEMNVSQLQEICLKQQQSFDASFEKKVVSIQETESALSAFRKMYIHRKNAIAIVNERGTLVAHLSASDLRGMTRSNIEKLLEKVTDFVQLNVKKHQETLVDDVLKTVEPDTLVNVLVSMASFID
jgi:CBS-domain-containing membrane protein